MKLYFDDEFMTIAKEIKSMNYGIEMWSEIESDDAFQTDKYSGGFDATESAFCFSFYSDDGKEYWFQVTLEEIDKILDGKMKELELIVPE